MTKVFKIEIECENDAFQPDPKVEVSKILGTIINQMLIQEKDGAVCIDTNGNKVGSWDFFGED